MQSSQRARAATTARKRKIFSVDLDGLKAGEHASLAPSAGERWLVCAGSVGAIAEQDPEDAPTIFSAEGSFAHEIHADALDLGVEARSFLGRTDTIHGFEFEADDAMVNAVQKSLDFIWSEPVTDEYIETRINLDDYGILGVWGTSDWFGYNHNRRLLRVVDYKHGQGVYVPHEAYPQTRIYAAGALSRVNLGKQYDNVDTVEISIAQPRYHGVEPVRTETLRASELVEWVEDVVKPAAFLASQPGAPLVASEKGCRWCPLKATCSTFRDFALETIGFEDVDDLHLLDTPEASEFKNVPASELVEILAHADLIETWLKAIRAFAYDRLTIGDPDFAEVFKLVRIVTKRRLNDPDAALAWTKKKRLTSSLTTRRMKSPAQAQAALEDTHPKLWAEFNETFVERPEGGMKLVKRDAPGADAMAGGVFDEVPLDGEELLG